MTRPLLSLCLIVLLLFSTLAAALEQEALSEHVNYLASKELNGRKPWSKGSRLAREYIMEHFKAAGLKPWGEADGYEQDIYLGTNLVGVLPGTDEALQDQAVLVSAHYDHLGGKRLGATDNASGVAVLLEFVKEFSQHPGRRPIIFASFDREEAMLFGAFAFTCRPDYDKGKIAAVVNMDMLGREFMGCADNVLFSLGTREFPQTRQMLATTGAANDLEVLPIGTDIAGMLSDHMAFVDIAGPCLFFTSGTFTGYHTKHDTVDTIDYDLLKRSADTVAVAVRALVDAPEIEPFSVDPGADLAELKTFRRLLPNVFAIDAETASKEAKEKQAQVLAKVDAGIANPNLTEADRKTLIWDSLPVLTPLVRQAMFGGTDQTTKRKAAQWSNEDLLRQIMMMLGMSEDLEQSSELYRRCVAQVLDRRPIPLIRPLGPVKQTRSSLRDKDLLFTHETDEQYRLCALMTEATAKGGMALVTPYGYIDGKINIIDFHGTLDDIIDYSLLSWKDNGKCFDQEYAKLLYRVTGESPGTSLEDWMKWRLDGQGLPDEQAWLKSLLKNNHLKFMALVHQKKDPEGQECIRTLCADKKQPSCLRAYLVGMCGSPDDIDSLRVLADILEEEVPQNDHEHIHSCFSYPGMPFSSDYRIAGAQWKAEEFQRKKLRPLPQPPQLTDAAHMRLKQLMHRSCGKDPEKWRACIERHARRLEKRKPTS